jgi:hypothetical protein
MDDPMAEFCLRCSTKLDEAGVARFISETVVIQTVLNQNLITEIGQSGCWGCPLTEKLFAEALTEAGVLEAKAEQFGGSYTSEKIAISRGEQYAIPTDKESSQK